MPDDLAALRKAARTVRDVAEWSAQHGDPLFEDETLAALSRPAPSLDVERLLAYLWTATGTDGETQPNHLFAEDDPLVADVRAVIARLSAEEPQPTVPRARTCACDGSRLLTFERPCPQHGPFREPQP
jgi:hypothetical protein